ncbi:MAG TPA: serine hydrolase domain-containing protein [Candidatus Limnocylindrales bacterium]|nr:serine hydrolase domain-containing protein [Candidatus Limnocylindrales bacterium]
MTKLEDAFRAADGVADTFLADRHILGVAYGVVVDGELVHARGIGTLRVGEEAPPDADSVFRIASMTKSFTAATIVGLRDEGLLALDDPIGRHVPELAGLRGPTADSPVITIRHLLTMSAGLATDDPWGDRQQGLDLAEFAAFLRGPLTFAWPPGTRFEYSNLGYGILGRLITNVVGAEYRDVVRERLLAPLGMTATTYLRADVPPERLALGYLWRDEAYLEEPIDPYGALAAMGGIFTSVRDLARWVAFFTDAFPPRDDPEGRWPLSRASRREMQQVHRPWAPEVVLPNPDADPTVRAGGYGFGLYAVDDTRWGRIVGHSGGYPGFGTSMRWHQASGLGVIVFGNHRYAPSTLLGNELMTSLLEADVAPARRIRPAAATVAARADVERLLEAWDDDVAGRLFAMNVELDEPIARRRAEAERIRVSHGRLSPDTTLPDESDTPLHASWWLAGERGGRVNVEILLSPQAPPLVQSLALTVVPEPSEALASIAASVIGAVNAADPALPDGLELGPALDRTALARVLRIVAGRYAPLVLGPAVAGDGVKSARWRVGAGGAPGERGGRPRPGLDLEVARDPETGLVTSLSLSQRPPVPPPHAD